MGTVIRIISFPIFSSRIRFARACRPRVCRASESEATISWRFQPTWRPGGARPPSGTAECARPRWGDGRPVFRRCAMSVVHWVGKSWSPPSGPLSSRSTKERYQSSSLLDYPRQWWYAVFACASMEAAGKLSKWQHRSSGMLFSWSPDLSTWFSCASCLVWLLFSPGDVFDL
jgi:hypothetical protein